MRGKVIRRVILPTLAALVSLFVAVIVITIADLYLVGHGYQSINREVLSWPGAGVSMSFADIFLLLVGLSTWCVTWFFLRRTA